MALLRRGGMTVDELATALGLIGNAVRQQLAVLERDGMVARGAVRRGTSRPAQVYALSRETELLFSRAYIPILTELLHVSTRALRGANSTRSCVRWARGS